MSAFRPSAEALRHSRGTPFDVIGLCLKKTSEENYQYIIKKLELEKQELKDHFSKLKDDLYEKHEIEIENLKGTINVLNEILGNNKKELKKIDALNQKIISYRKLIQVLVSVENGEILVSEVK